MKTKQPLLKQFKSLLLAALMLGAFTQVGYGQNSIGHTLVICENGQIMSCGRNGSKQLGLGPSSPGDFDLLQPVVGLTGKEAVATAVGFLHSLAVMEDGSVYAWGSNSQGAVGQPTSTSTFDTPTQVPLNGCASAVSAGDRFSLALLADGTVWSWGFDGNGQLGDSPTPSSGYMPRQVTGITNAIAIAAGSAHGMALLADGTIKT